MRIFCGKKSMRWDFDVFCIPIMLKVQNCWDNAKKHTFVCRDIVCFFNGIRLRYSAGTEHFTKYAGCDFLYERKYPRFSEWGYFVFARRVEHCLIKAQCRGFLLFYEN